MGKHRIGLVGCGSIAQKKHLPALAVQAHRAELVGFCDIIEERAKGYAETYGTPEAKYYTDYRELMKDDSIDIVYVCTPNVSHCEITCAALEAGKHVLCEKPMAVTGAEAQKMVDTAKRTGKKLTVGYQNRFRMDSQFLKEAINEGHLGEIYYGEALAIRRRAVPTWGVFIDKEKQGGGPLIDIGTHALDLTLWSMNNYDVKSVTGVSFHKLGNLEEATYGNLFGRWDHETYDVEDSAMGCIKFKNGAFVYLKSAWALNTTDVREAMCTLSGTKGGAEMKREKVGADITCTLNMTMGKQLVTVHPAEKPPVAYQELSNEKASDDAVMETSTWLDAIENHTDPVVLPEQAATVTKILEAIYISNQTGKEVLFD